MRKRGEVLARVHVRVLVYVCVSVGNAETTLSSDDTINDELTLLLHGRMNQLPPTHLLPPAHPFTSHHPFIITCPASPTSSLTSPAANLVPAPHRKTSR